MPGENVDKRRKDDNIKLLSGENSLDLGIKRIFVPSFLHMPLHFYPHLWISIPLLSFLGKTRLGYFFLLY